MARKDTLYSDAMKKDFTNEIQLDGIVVNSNTKKRVCWVESASFKNIFQVRLLAVTFPVSKNSRQSKHRFSFTGTGINWQYCGFQYLLSFAVV